MLATNRIRVSLFDLVTSLSNVADLVNSALDDHHKKVAYIAYSLAQEMGWPKQECCDILLAGMLHDIGALSLKEKMDALHFEVAAPHRHAEAGGFLLKPFAPLAQIGEMIACHHVPWENGTGKVHHGRSVPLAAHILHLADRVAVLLKKSQAICGRNSTALVRKIEAQTERMFMPEVSKAFLSLAQKNYFWLDLSSRSLGSLLRRKVRAKIIELDLIEIGSLAQVFSRVIDFRSSFTATHSSGVATIAEAMAQLVGYSEDECGMMKVAGYLHDLGKLAIPTEILEKNGPLTKREAEIVRSHPFHTYRALEHIEDFNTIIRWAAFHHETPNGGGYPFNIIGNELPLGSRIIAVSDVFTAITENRPYRQGMDSDQTKNVLMDQAATGRLDPKITALLLHNYHELNAVREKVQTELNCEYSALNNHLNSICTGSHLS